MTVTVRPDGDVEVGETLVTNSVQIRTDITG